MENQRPVPESIAHLKSAIAQTRKQLLDLLELCFNDHPKWPAARTCVLRTLGKSGLEGAIDSVIAREVVDPSLPENFNGPR